MTPAQHDVVRAAWETIRRMGLSLEVAAEFRTRLEEQIKVWSQEDAEQVPGMVA